MKQLLPIGTSDFRQLRRAGLRYVDKSGLITEILRSSARILLLPRPRRFGKTLAMTTLAAYLERTTTDDERTERATLFEDLAVWQAGDDIRSDFVRYPVLLLSFKDVKAQTWADCRMGISDVVAALCERYEPLLSTACLSDRERSLVGLLQRGDADNVTLWGSLKFLSKLLHKATGEPCVILIDEYDTPLHAALEHGYYEDAVELFRNLLSGAFKDNSHLYKGVLTGILHVTKESIFSGLNNLSVHTLLSSKFSQHFGFTPVEVAQLAEEYGLSAHMSDIEAWYNGYNFGGQTVYNPWSVLSYLSQPEEGLQPFWVNTASDALLRELLVDRALVRHADLETLLTGGTLTKTIDEHVVLRKLRHQAGAVWSLLLFSGYLKATSTRRVEGELVVELAVPNAEVRMALRRLFTDFLAEGVGGSERVSELCAALLQGDTKTFGRLLGTLLKTNLSYHDMAGGRGRQPEAVYQAFIVGLLVTLERTHQVRSNRESGYGRYDVMVLPRQGGEPGAVLELKVIDTDEHETVEQALDSAAAQLKDRDYATELREQGAEPVVQMAAVFDGKRVWVRVVGESYDGS